MKVTNNTKAVLLLCAPLLLSKEKANGVKPLTLGNYNALAKRLVELGRTPADLLGDEAEATLAALGDSFDHQSIEKLLGRGLLMGKALERWAKRGIWVISRSDQEYPERFRQKLKGKKPPLIYGFGDPSLFGEGGLAVVGSRNANNEQLDVVKSAVIQATKAGCAIVTGGAKGIDYEALKQTLEHGGKAVVILPSALYTQAVSETYREAIKEGRCLVISVMDPQVRFQPWAAMERNKYIYALSNVALVAASTFGKGGTWAGAVEQLDKLQFVPVFVNTRSGGDGAKALIQRGAKKWDQPATSHEFEAWMQEVKTWSPTHVELPLFSGASQNQVQEPAAVLLSNAGAQVGEKVDSSSQSMAYETLAKELKSVVTPILLRALVEPRKAQELALDLQIKKTQIDVWLKELLSAGLVVKLKRPVRFVVKHEEQQKDLFER